MSREMFTDVVRPAAPAGTGRRYTVSVSILTHTAVVGGLVAAQIFAGDFLPTPRSVLAYVVVPAPALPELPPPVAPATPRLETRASVDAAPIEAPSVISLDPPAPPRRTLSMTDAVVGVPGGVPGGTGTPTVGIAAPEPARRPDPIRPGGAVEAPVKTRDVLPIYPAHARTARVEGIVIIEAIIATDGTVRDARVLRSIPLLDGAALEAVRQWRYRPTRLNGVPVEVVMTVTVMFSLR